MQEDRLSQYYNWLRVRVEDKKKRRMRNPRNRSPLQQAAYCVLPALSVPVSPSKEEPIKAPQAPQVPQVLVQMEESEPKFAGDPQLTPPEAEEVSESRIVAPDDLTPDQFLSLLNNKCPYLKYSSMAPMHSSSNYTQEYVTPNGSNQNLLIPQFSYKNQDTQMYLQSSHRNDYRASNPDKSMLPDLRSSPKIVDQQKQVTYSSEYSLKYKRGTPSPSISMKPQAKVTKLPALEHYLSNYSMSFDRRPQQGYPEKVRRNKNESTMRNLIQADLDLSPQSEYKKSFQVMSMRSVSTRQERNPEQTVFFTPSYAGQYNSVASTEYREYQLPKPEQINETQDLLRLINIIQKSH